MTTKNTLKANIKHLNAALNNFNAAMKSFSLVDLGYLEEDPSGDDYDNERLAELYGKAQAINYDLQDLIEECYLQLEFNKTDDTD